MGKIIRNLVIIVLCLAMVLGTASVVAATENSMTMSDNGIALLKQFEGFAETPYWDYGQYSVGYGTRCPSGDYNRYCKYGIPEKEADSLLRKHLKGTEKAVNAFAEKHHIEFTQNEFDAICSFTYNVGTGWMKNEDGLFTQAVIHRAKGNDFMFAMTQWCMAGGKILTGLVDRRLSEANVYLNGEYDRTVPENFKYVKFDWTSSELWGKERTVRIQAYDANLDTIILPEGIRDGYKFLGWYTLPVGGTWITNLHDVVLNGNTVYAHWQKLDETETPANYNRTVAHKTVTVKEPKLFAEEVREIQKDEIITVTAEYVDFDEYGNIRKWGKLEDGSWINLQVTRDTKMSDYQRVAHEATKNVPNEGKQETLWTRILDFLK
jgi:GH24 family phage-related lysozyme (muramidase)